jgi:serine/threonine protein phosphatase PrpC
VTAPDPDGELRAVGPAGPDRELAVALAGASDVGTVRETNEDQMLVGDLDSGQLAELATEWRTAAMRGPLLVVCDGMGGVVGGEVASTLAAKVIWREMRSTPATHNAEVFARLLRRATRVANHEVHALSEREQGLRGMGTTVSAAGIAGDRLVIATVGDSRAYVLRAGLLVQVTADQSLSQALIAAGRSPTEAATAGGSAILQALGASPDVEPSLSVIPLRRGDRVLLCSDGLHGLVSDPAIALLIGEPHTVAQSVSLLVTAARAAGGSDNITAIVADVSGTRLSPPVGDDDRPTFREFDPQKEGDPALTDTSYVARRLAARAGIPTNTVPPSLPVTGQHPALQSRIGMRLSATVLPIDDEVPGPARARLRETSLPVWLVALAVAIALTIAWVLGGR